jgi:hypothetical protein
LICSVVVVKGGDDIDQLCEANDEEFKEICDLVGMSSKPLHVKRLRKAIDEYKTTSTTTIIQTKAANSHFKNASGIF